MCMRSLQGTVRSPRIPKLMGRPSNSSTRPCTHHPPQRLTLGFPSLSASPSCALHTYTHGAQDTRVEYRFNITTRLCKTQKMEIKFIYSNALLSKIQMTLKRETYPNSTSYIKIANSLGTDKIQIGLRVLKITKRDP